jgi:Na+/H+ antiporter NhaD/arsenite permease-like protein
VVIAQTFKIKFAAYTANMVVLVVITTLMLFPFLLYVVFADENLIPMTIRMRDITEEQKHKKSQDPQIPNVWDDYTESDGEDSITAVEPSKRLKLEEILNPYLDKRSALFGILVLAATLVVLLTLSATNETNIPVYWVTLPAATIMLIWDATFGWIHRRETRYISRKRRHEIEEHKAQRVVTVDSGRPRVSGGSQEAERVIAGQEPMEKMLDRVVTHRAISWPDQSTRTVSDD